MPSETSGGFDQCRGVALRFPGAAFEEGVSVRIEESAMPRGQAPGTVTAAIVKQPGQGDNLRPRAVAAVHGVRILAVVGTEAFIQTGNGIVLQPGFVGAHQAAVFGVENEDHAHQRGEHAAVNVVGVMLECVGENLATGPRGPLPESRGPVRSARAAPGRRAGWRLRSGSGVRLRGWREGAGFLGR